MGTALHRVDFAGKAVDADATDHARRLLQVASEILSLADELDGGRLASAEQGDDQRSIPVADRHAIAALAREAYRGRRMRAQFFDDAEMFGEPAWDVLLDLFIAACDGKAVPVTSACIGAAVPTTTALRWLTVLEKKGLVERQADGSDARRIFVRLTAQADQAMTAYFTRMSAGMRSDEPRLPFMLGK